MIFVFLCKRLSVMSSVFPHLMGLQFDKLPKMNPLICVLLSDMGMLEELTSKPFPPNHFPKDFSGFLIVASDFWMKENDWHWLVLITVVLQRLLQQNNTRMEISSICHRFIPCGGGVAKPFVQHTYKWTQGKWVTCVTPNERVYCYESLTLAIIIDCSPFFMHTLPCLIRCSVHLWTIQ